MFLATLTPNNLGGAMHKSVVFSLAAAISVSLAGCSGGMEAETTPTPTPTYATTAQVASVVAGYEQDWRDKIDDAAACRFAFVLQPTGLEAATCTFTEQTIGLTAQTASGELLALDVPPELTTLTADTMAVLDDIGARDFDAACIVGGTYTDSESCTSLLGERMSQYSQLETQLDKWSPYL